MRRPLAALGLTMALGAPASANVPIVLPHPPPVVNSTSMTLRRAVLAIARAQQIDPHAAQTASFQYVKAVQQYDSGNFAGANASALQALSTAAQAQVEPAAVPAPAAPPQPVPPQVPGLAGGLYGAAAPAIDADAFLALARGTLADCAGRRDRRLDGARKLYAQAEQSFTRRAWQAVREQAKAAIEACAKS